MMNFVFENEELCVSNEEFVFKMMIFAGHALGQSGFESSAIRAEEPYIARALDLVTAALWQAHKHHQPFYYKITLC